MKRFLMAIMAVLILIMACGSGWADAPAAPKFKDVKDGGSIEYTDYVKKDFTIKWGKVSGAQSYTVWALVLDGEPARGSSGENGTRIDGGGMTVTSPSASLELDSWMVDHWLKIAVRATGKDGNSPTASIYLKIKSKEPSITIANLKDGGSYTQGKSITLDISGKRYHHFFYRLSCDGETVRQSTEYSKIKETVKLERAGDYTLYVVATTSKNTQNTGDSSTNGKRVEKTIHFTVKSSSKETPTPVPETEPAPASAPDNDPVELPIFQDADQPKAEETASGKIAEERTDTEGEDQPFPQYAPVVDPVWDDETAERELTSDTEPEMEQEVVSEGKPNPQNDPVILPVWDDEPLQVPQQETEQNEDQQIEEEPQDAGLTLPDPEYAPVIDPTWEEEPAQEVTPESEMNSEMEVETEPAVAAEEAPNPQNDPVILPAWEEELVKEEQTNSELDSDPEAGIIMDIEDEPLTEPQYEQNNEPVWNEETDMEEIYAEETHFEEVIPQYTPTPAPTSTPVPVSLKIISPELDSLYVVGDDIPVLVTGQYDHMRMVIFRDGEYVDEVTAFGEYQDVFNFSEPGRYALNAMATNSSADFLTADSPEQGDRVTTAIMFTVEDRATAEYGETYWQNDENTPEDDFTPVQSESELSIYFENIGDVELTGDNEFKFSLNGHCDHFSLMLSHIIGSDEVERIPMNMGRITLPTPVMSIPAGTAGLYQLTATAFPPEGSSQTPVSQSVTFRVYDASYSAPEVSLSLRNEKTGEIYAKREIFDADKDEQMYLAWDYTGGNGEIEVKAFVMNSAPVFSDKETANAVYYLYGSERETAVFTAEALAAWNGCIPFDFSGFSEGQYVKIWVGARDVNYGTNHIMAAVQFGLKLSVSEKYITPLSGVTSRRNGFGSTYANKSYTYNDLSRNYHIAIDYAANEGTPIMAFAKGRVWAAAYNDSNGNYVIIQHSISGKTVYSFYAHMSSISVHTGDPVSAGQQIGVIGNTGSAAGEQTHLHFSVVDTFSEKGSYYGYATEFEGDAVDWLGIVFYNPDYIIQYGKLPTNIAIAPTSKGDLPAVSSGTGSAQEVQNNNPEQGGPTDAGQNGTAALLPTMYDGIQFVSYDIPTISVTMGDDTFPNSDGEPYYADEKIYCGGESFVVQVRNQNCGRLSMFASMVRNSPDETVVYLGEGRVDVVNPAGVEELMLPVDNNQKPGVYEINIYASNSTLANDTDSRVKRAHLKFYIYVHGDGNYDAEAATEYAKKWVNNVSPNGWDETAYNPGYKNWNGKGLGDCASFVSQCLIAGGFIPNTSWTVNKSGSWTVASYLRDYLVGLGYKATKDIRLENIQKGDIITSNGGNHIMIVTDVDRAGKKIEYCGHNYDQKRYTAGLDWITEIIQIR